MKNIIEIVLSILGCFFNYHCIHDICVDFIIDCILANRIVGWSCIFRIVMRAEKGV